MPLFQLYCLHCNRPNDAESRYCSGCGSGLIRKFCPRCHAVNGADSHFCQACGAPLPMPPVAEPMQPQADVPRLTDTVEMPDATGMAPVFIEPTWATASGGGVAIRSLPAAALPLPAVTPTPTRRSKGLLSPARLALGALGAGAVVALSAAVSLWPSSGALEVESRADARMNPPAGPRPMAEATAAATVVPVRAAPATTAAPMKPAADRPGVAATPVANDAVAAALSNAQKALAADTAPARAVGVVAVAPAGAARARPSKQAASASPPSRPPDCTPEVYALGLCAPGAKIIGRP